MHTGSEDRDESLCLFGSQAFQRTTRRPLAASQFRHTASRQSQVGPTELSSMRMYLYLESAVRVVYNLWGWAIVVYWLSILLVVLSSIALFAFYFRYQQFFSMHLLSPILAIGLTLSNFYVSAILHVSPSLTKRCTNSATDRACWGDYDLSTNYYTEAPDTGDTVEVCSPFFKYFISWLITTTGLVRAYQYISRARWSFQVGFHS